MQQGKNAVRLQRRFKPAKLHKRARVNTFKTGPTFKNRFNFEQVDENDVGIRVRGTQNVKS